MPNCKQCNTAFEITDSDRKFYNRVSPIFGGKKYLIPEPTLCPDCRLQRRLAFRNERTLYHRKSDFSGKEIVSIFVPDKPFKVYDQSEWWSDKWDATEYGRDFDFSRSFSVQLGELYRVAPHVSLYTTNTENSYYTNHSLNCRNCYLMFGAADDEDCLYGKFVIGCKNTLDGLNLYQCELCYEGVASEGCYNCKYFLNCKNCAESIFIEECQNCKHCIGCFGLANKEYYVFNRFVDKEKFENFQQDLSDFTNDKIEKLKTKFEPLRKPLPHRYAHIYASENCTGDMIVNSKDCQYCFDIKNSEDCKYIAFSPNSLNSHDCCFTAPKGVELCYNCISTLAKFGLANFMVWHSDNAYYSMECHNCSHIFGCVGLNHKKYCIMNKQYSKEEYEKIVARIAEHMQKTGEWGEFLPFKNSAFGYNESIAQEYFPVTKEGAIKIGASWREEDSSNQAKQSSVTIPESIKDVRTLL